MTIEAQHADRQHNHDAHEKLIQRVIHSLGPANDAGQALNNISFAQRLVAALIELKLISLARSTEQDQPKKEDGQSKLGPREPHRGR